MHDLLDIRLNKVEQYLGLQSSKQESEPEEIERNEIPTIINKH